MANAKSEMNQEKSRFEIKVEELEAQRNESLKNEKILEERLRQAVSAKERDEKAIADKYILQIKDLETRIKGQETKIKKLEDELKGAQETNVKKSHEYEKGSALMEQKL